MLHSILIILFQGGLTLLAVGAIAYLCACLFMFLRQTRFIFFPSRLISMTPDDVGLSYQDIELQISTPSGKIETVHCWWIPSETNPNQKVIIDLHGNRNTIEGNIGYAEQFHEMGLSVLLVEYRGYGRSTNRFPSEKTVYQDVEAAWNYLVNERQINPHNIYVFGHSLGGAIAINLALKHTEIAGLIIESSFTNIREMIDYKKKYWMFPINLILTQKFDSLAKISALKMPILLTHGTEDELIPKTMSEDLFNAAIEPKQLLIVAGAGHNNVRQVGGKEYWETVQQFLTLQSQKPGF
ncbi:alpha/beta fold hydrolase [Planktothrix agardhii 1806]|nr:alpha/beta fold hydrolase [Planktothrix agardhii]MCB8753294.1 alpha/beta fold hydrolase [Planktothrix agardhii 1810]MCB8760769.1 alpha/beta fold hydrolase [Planktothrix agardhii 1813]MCB8788573.1 alpha/beta fold hydrolase [Planktothrix agardhii 1025]MCF3570127.1 alpha/beta fold hydrolase [Planktothrix agardhii 1805]MCF3576490.1 alpha/beta fold hydrolase [Planktothrix agardhii 1812]MCF3582522.1 alpha/beta fold hydrolase [Planktothrix agardhii 1811]MCF3586823.1 alpha/beta fold hydrolase [Pl